MSAGWYAVVLLSLITAISYVDRLILGLLAEPVKRSLAISDTQLGMAIGLGFGIVYALSGLPIAYLLDRGNRVRIVGIAVTVWSLFTFCSGFASNLAALMTLRAGIAIGEAALLPASVSLMADLFTSERRAAPMSMIMGVTVLMGGGTFVIGGLVYNAAQLLAPTLQTEAWRLTLIAVGIPGLLLGPLWMLSVKEPAREPMPMREVELGSVVDFFRASWQFYVFLYLAFGFFTMATYSFFSWTPSILVRNYGMSVGGSGVLFGTVGIAANVIGIIFWSSLATYFMRRRSFAATLVLLLACEALSLLALASIALTDSVMAISASIAAANFAISGCTNLLTLSVQNATPSRFRARMISLNLLIATLLGLVTGPTLCAWIAENVIGGSDGLRLSLSMMSLCLAPLVILSLMATVRPYRRLLAATNDQSSWHGDRTAHG
jgi:MFS family permease